MRQFKFQCIYKPTGEKFEPFKIDFVNKTVFGSFDGAEYDYCHYSLDGERGDAVLRRFTGIKDRNDQELYFDDKVDVYYGTYKHLESDTISNLDDLVSLINNMEDSGATFEIVGGIHENK